MININISAKKLSQTTYFPAIVGIFIGIIIILSAKYSILLIVGLIAAAVIIINPYLGILLYLLTLALPPGLYISFTSNATAGLGCLLLILAGKNKLKKTHLNWLLPIMYFAAILPAFLVEGVMRNYLNYPNTLLTVIFYSLTSLIIINLVDSAERFEFLYKFIVLIGVIIGITCVLQSLNLDPFEKYIYGLMGRSHMLQRGASLVNVETGFQSLKRAIGYTRDAVATGAIEQSIFFLALALILTKKSFWGKTIFCLIALVLFMGLFTTFSRSVWVSSSIGCMYWWYKKGMKKKELFLALIIILLLSYCFRGAIYERYYQTFVNKDFKKDEISYQISQLRRFADNPFIGTGLGHINEFPQVRDYFADMGFYSYFDPEAEQEVVDADVYTEDSQVQLTSFLPGFANQLGIIGLFSVLLIMFYTWKSLCCSEKIFKSINDQKLYYLTIGIKSSYVALLIHLFMRGDQTARMLWILLGLSWSIYNIAVKKKEEHVSI